MKIKILVALIAFIFIMQPSVQASMEVVDDEGHIFYFDKPVKRIVSLAPHITELLFAAGATNQIVGTVNYSDYPKAATKIPLVGAYNKFDIETLIEMRPDLIVAWASGNPQEQIDKIRRLGFTVFISEPKTFEDVAKNVRVMGELMGTQKVAEQVASVFLNELNLLKQQYPPDKPVNVFYQVWNDPLMTLTDEHLVGQAIKFCSGKNVFGDLSVISPRVNIEAVIEKNPDVIIAGMTKNRREWLKAWDKWTVLKAVENRHVYAIDASLVIRQTPRILQGTGKMCEYLAIVRNRTY